MDRLAVVVPSRNIDNLGPCLRALIQHEPTIRIIVVDDGIDWQRLPGDIEREVVCQVIPGIKPFVFARNVNDGIRVAGDSDVVLMNDDALLETPGGFTVLQRTAADHPDFGIIAATTDLTGQPLQRRLGEGDPRFGLREVEHVAFVCVMIPHRARHRLLACTGWQKHPEGEEMGERFTGGLLDERYAAYGSDDLDYCMQVRAAGLKVGVDDRCFVNHSKLHSSYRGLPTQPGDIWPNHRLLRKKWGLQPEYHPGDPMGQR